MALTRTRRLAETCERCVSSKLLCCLVLALLCRSIKLRLGPCRRLLASSCASARGNMAANCPWVLVVPVMGQIPCRTQTSLISVVVPRPNPLLNSLPRFSHMSSMPASAELHQGQRALGQQCELLGYSSLHDRNRSSVQVAPFDRMPSTTSSLTEFTRQSNAKVTSRI